jgi:hypothetical protein
LEEELEEILDEETRSVNVFYDFEAGADDELSLSAGDMVAVISFVGDEWIKGLSSSRDNVIIFRLTWMSCNLHITIRFVEKISVSEFGPPPLAVINRSFD